MDITREIERVQRLRDLSLDEAVLAEADGFKRLSDEHLARAWYFERKLADFQSKLAGTTAPAH